MGWMISDRQSGPVFTFDGLSPQISNNVFIAPTAAVIGDVTIKEGASIWFSSVVRGDDMPITIGCNTNIQDGAVIHSTENVAATVIGNNVVVGHGAIIHGATIGDNALIGMGAIILDGAIVGNSAVVAAGAVVPPGKHVPPETLWLGSPGKVVRATRPEEHGFVSYATEHYRSRAKQYVNDGIGFTVARDDA
jgi:carbonic anhydrase/acetyltransferase-like protein (isoleucine patch superfamily)